MGPHDGETVYLRESGEPARVLATLDAAGTLLVHVDGEEPFQVARDDIETIRERHAGCGCCG